MTTDDDWDGWPDDEDGDLDLHHLDFGERGHAAVVHRVSTLGVRIRFCPNLADAQRLAAQPCDVAGCLGAHLVVHRDLTGRLRMIPASDDDAIMDRYKHTQQVQRIEHNLRASISAIHRRAAIRAALEARQRPPETHCYQGHEYSPENTYMTPEGKRQCRQCRRDRRRREREKRN